MELDAVLQHHQDMQEKLAEEMLSLARSLKNNTLAAQNVIKQDNQVVWQCSTPQFAILGGEIANVLKTTAVTSRWD